MTSPLPLPEWVPPWVHLVVLLILLLFGLMFLLMPFSVFGVKARLEGVEARLDEIQGEIRSLALRLPEAGPADEVEYDDDRPLPRPATPMGNRPPIPPAPRRPGDARGDARREGRGGGPSSRSEPRLY